jgi:hypothetical protein
MLSLQSAQASSPALKPVVKPVGKTSLQCVLDRATYSAIGKPAFELQFSPIENRKIATESVALTLQHRDRGMLTTYHIGGTMGYGSYVLRDLSRPIEEDTGDRLRTVFFDANWQEVKDISRGNAPKYLFISGLGSNDWYADRANNRKQPLREVMWQISNCRP